MTLSSADIEALKGMTTVNFYRALYEIAREVNSSLAVDEVLNAMVRSVTRAMGMKGCSVMLLTPDRSQLVHVAAYGLSDWYVRKGPVRTDVPIMTALEGQPDIVADVATDERVVFREQALKEGIASIMSLPVKLAGETIGVLRVYSATRRRFTAQEVEFMTGVASIGAIALDKARAHEALHREQQALAEDLERRKKELARVEEAKSQLMRFMSVVAHDLKSPLAAIQSYFSVLLGGYSGPLTDKQKQMIERSSQRVVGLLELISDLLDISRIELGTAFQEKKDISPLEVLKAPLEDAQAAAQQKNVAIELRAPPDLPRVSVSPARLQQVFANLLSNAVKFTPPGGMVTVTGRLHEDGNIRFEVADTGIGIPPQDLPQMFQEFFRASNVLGPAPGAAPQTPGTGLGLAIVRRILERYGGKIWAESPCPDTGVGTRFTFQLPTAGEKMERQQGVGL